MQSSNEVYNNNLNTITYNSSNNCYHLLLNDITNDINYSDLTNIIEGCYERNEYFKLIIETKNLERKKIHMKYLYKLAQFLKKMKNREPTYLLKTTIHVYDDFTNNLLYTLFTFLSSPLAQVEIIYYKSRDNNNLENIKKINNYYPHK